MRRARQTVLAVLAMAVVANGAGAQLPTVTQVYDAYATAVGGRAAWEKVTDRADKGSANVTFANLIGTYVRYQSAPNKYRMIMDLGVGVVEQGSDGKLVWNDQPGTGAALMEGPDVAYVLENAATGNAFLNPALFASAAVVAKETFDGVECYKVTIRTKSGHDRTDYFEVATGLRRGQVLQVAGGPQKNLMRDYKAFDGKKVPSTIVQANGQGDIVITVTEVTFAANDPALFVVPPGIAK